MKKTIPVMFALCFMAFNAHSETWNVQEGVNGEWSGEWTIDGSNKEFSCSQRNGGQSLTAKCTVIRDGNKVAVSKRQVSDGNPCNYFGEMTDGRIKGQFFCRSGGPYDWSAQVSK